MQKREDPVFFHRFDDNDRMIGKNQGFDVVDTGRETHRNEELSVSFHKYGDVCGGRDGVEFAKRRRRDVSDIVEEKRQRNRRRPAATLRADGGCG